MKLTGGGKLLYLITNPAVTKAASLATISKVKESGINSCHVRHMNNVATKTLSAMGSKNEPIFEDWPFHVLAIHPSSCGNFLNKYLSNFKTLNFKENRINISHYII